MKTSLLISTLLLSSLLAACSKEHEDAPVVPEYPKTFLFDKAQPIDDFTCYVGSASGGVLDASKDPKAIWKNRLTINPQQIVLIDESTLRVEPSSISYDYKLQHDSLFTRNGADAWDFAAELKSEKLIYHLGFERYTKDSDMAWQSGIGQSVRLMNYSKMFGGIFSSPAEMIHVKDTVAWCNVYYEYNLQQ